MIHSVRRGLDGLNIKVHRLDFDGSLMLVLMCVVWCTAKRDALEISFSGCIFGMRAMIRSSAWEALSRESEARMWAILV